MNLTELRTLWAATIDSMEALNNKAKSAKRSFTAEEKKTYSDLDTRETNYREQILHLEKPTTNPVDAGITLPNTQPSSRGLTFTSADGKEIRALEQSQNISRVKNDLSFGKAVRSWITGDWSGASEEARALSSQTGSLGGWLVPSSLSEKVIDLARSKSVCLKAGALTLPMETGQVTLVKVATDPTPYWRGELQSITESSPTFEPVVLNALVVGVLVRMPLELIQDAANSPALIEQLIANTIALEIDRKMLFGLGVGEMRGLYNTPSVQQISFGDNGATPANYDNFSSAVELIATQNGEAQAVIFHPRTQGTLDRLKDTTNQPLVAPGSYQELAKYATSSIPVDQVQGTATNASTAFVGDFSQMVLGVRSELRLEASPHADDAFAKMAVMIRGYVRCDLAILRPLHFTKLIGIKP